MVGEYSWWSFRACAESLASLYPCRWDVSPGRTSSASWGAAGDWVFSIHPPLAGSYGAGCTEEALGMAERRSGVSELSLDLPLKHAPGRRAHHDGGVCASVRVCAHLLIAYNLAR